MKAENLSKLIKTDPEAAKKVIVDELARAATEPDEIRTMSNGTVRFYRMGKRIDWKPNQ